MYSENDWRDYKELYHHGILGQKWGVRNGPPYPLEDSKDRYFKAGTTFYRTTDNTHEIPGYRVYLTSLREDADRYAIAATRMKETYYQIEFQNKEPIKLASKTKVQKAYKKLIDSMDDYELCKAIYGKAPEDDEDAYYTAKPFRRAVENPNKIHNITDVLNRVFIWNGDLSKQLISELEASGYDGFEDFFDKESGYTKSPMVLFSNEKLLKTKMRDVNDLDYGDLKLEDLSKWLDL